MNFFLDALIFFKRKNFTVLREFDIGENKRIKEYSYGSNTYLTDTWPPPRGVGFPIKKVLLEDGEEDITNQALKFSGPMKNHVNVLALYKKKKRFVIRFVNGGFKFTLEDYWEPREGTVIITDILDRVKKETLVLSTSTNGDANFPS